MRELNVDVAVIGAGTAGLSAFRAARKQTDKVVLIEGGPHGTTCARVGCMPSKLLIAAAESVHHMQISRGFGIESGPVVVHGEEVMDRVRRERDRFVGFVVESVENIDDRYKLSGYARFLDNNSLQIDDHTRVHAQSIVIATGSSPIIPPGFDALGDRLIINDHVFDWQTLPQSVAVFGPGVIGLELGQALHRLGVRVKVFGRGGGVGPISDPQLLEYTAKTFSEEFPLYPDAHVSAMGVEDGQAVITFRDHDGQNKTEHFDYALCAVGRKPNLDRLDLGNTNLIRDTRGVPHFDPYTLQAGNTNIFIAGDVNNYIPLLHEAADEGRIAGENAGRYPDIRAGKRRSSLGVVFSDPQIATVGMRHSDLKPGCFATGMVSFEDQGRSRVMQRNKGRLHVYAEHGTGQFMGAEMLGPAAEHIGHLLAWAHQQRLTIQQMLEMPFYHPVIEEGLRTALRDAVSKLHLGPEPVPRCLDCGPGA